MNLIEKEGVEGLTVIIFFYLEEKTSREVLMEVLISVPYGTE